MPNNIYRFRRIKWGAPKRFKAMPRPARPAVSTQGVFALIAAVVVIGAVLQFLS